MYKSSSPKFDATLMPTRKLNLILIVQKRMTGLQDFLRIAEIIKGKCEDVVPHVTTRHHAIYKQFRYLIRPSLYVAFYEANGFKPIRGRRFGGVKMTKSEQYLQMEESGLETLQWQMIKPNERYEPSDWGPYVIVKPDEGKMGHDVKIRKTGRIHYEKDCETSPHLIQRFLHTGKQPESYRALTFFGEILYLQKSTNTACGNLLNDPTKADEMGGHNPVATASKGRAQLVVDEEIIAYAKQIAQTAFGNIPVLGQDVVRDPVTGKLYCLEVNPYGSTWHFSGSVGKAIQSNNELVFEEQFDAFNKVADILIRKTRENAR